MPWLQEANPHINWSILEVPPRKSEEARLAEVSALHSVVPSMFHQFLSVFGNEFFVKLPPHHAYNCAINLEEGKDTPYGPIYPMTPKESLALKLGH